MNKKQFLDLMDGIDDDLIENFLDIPSERIYIAKRTPIWKTAVSTAAAVCVLTAGIFTAVNLHGTLSSADSNASDQTSPGNSASLTEPVVNNKPRPTKDPGDFSFSLEGRDDLYFGVSGAVNKSGSAPAEVKITYGNLSLTNRAYLSVTGDANWPEENILSEVVMVDSITGCELHYIDDREFSDTPLYLLAVTADDAGFEGHWKP